MPTTRFRWCDTSATDRKSRSLPERAPPTSNSTIGASSCGCWANTSGNNKDPASAGRSDVSETSVYESARDYVVKPLLGQPGAYRQWPHRHRRYFNLGGAPERQTALRILYGYGHSWFSGTSPNWPRPRAIKLHGRRSCTRWKLLVAGGSMRPSFATGNCTGPWKLN